jgi:hypothetical protein
VSAFELVMAGLLGLVLVSVVVERKIEGGQS